MSADVPVLGSPGWVWDLSEEITEGLRMISLPTRDSGYEVARIIWHIDPYLATGRGLQHAAVALEAALRSAGPSTNGLTLAEWLESRGVIVAVGRTHFACYLEMRGLRESVRSSIAIVGEALASCRPSRDAVRVARTSAAGSAEAADRRLEDRARMALYAAFVGKESALCNHPDGSAEAVGRTDSAQVESAFKVLSESALTVVFSDDRAAESWSDAWQRGISDHRPTAAAANASIIREDLRPRAHVSVPGPRGCYHLWGILAEDVDPEDRVAVEIAAHALGGWWQARWQNMFREELAMTYGTCMRIHHFSVGPKAYSLAAVGMAAKDDVGMVGSLLEAEACRFAAEGLTEHECRSSAEQILRAECLFADSARKAVSRVSEPLQEGFPSCYHAERLAHLSSVAPSAVNLRLKRLVERMAIATATGENLRHHDYFEQ